MREKELSLDDATKVWWAWVWRTLVVAIPLHLLVGYVLVSTNIQTYGAQDWLLIIIDLAVSIYFLRLAINKEYDTFRIVAIEKDSDKQ